jgi:Transposase DDE domain group 1
MPNWTEENGNNDIEFGPLGRRVVEARFDDGSMTSDGRVMLVRATGRNLFLLNAPAGCIADPRNPLFITYDMAHMLRQRVYCLALGRGRT